MTLEKFLQKEIDKICDDWTKRKVGMESRGHCLLSEAEMSL